MKEAKERAKRNTDLKEKLEALLKNSSDFEDFRSQLPVAQRRALSEAVRSWNYEISQIIKFLQR